MTREIRVAPKNLISSRHHFSFSLSILVSVPTFSCVLLVHDKTNLALEVDWFERFQRKIYILGVIRFLISNFEFSWQDIV